jgi:hypothetical protein
MFDPAVNPLTGKFWYVVADIVLAVKPFVNVVEPVTVPPVKVVPDDVTPVTAIV